MTRNLLATALLASAAALLIAAGPKADLDQDGQVTKAEFTQTALDRFAAADTNGDNYLSEDERKALHKARREKREARRFERLDANKDGSISREEMEIVSQKRDARRSERRAKMLERYDTNFDGKLSETERKAIRDKRITKYAERKTRRGERPRPDANGDGLISLDEHLAVADKLFARMDADQNGVLTKGEGKKRKGRKGKRRFGR